MKKVLFVVAVCMILAMLALPAFADPTVPLDGPNPPTTGAGRSWDPPTDQPNAGHGAFQWFADPSLHFTFGQPPYFRDDLLGSARYGATGEVNRH